MDAQQFAETMLRREILAVAMCDQHWGGSAEWAIRRAYHSSGHVLRNGPRLNCSGFCGIWNLGGWGDSGRYCRAGNKACEDYTTVEDNLVSHLLSAGIVYRGRDMV